MVHFRCAAMNPKGCSAHGDLMCWRSHLTLTHRYWGMLMKLLALLIFVLALGGGPAFAQSLAGQWQGMVETQPGTKARYAITIDEAANGALSGNIYNVDANADPTAIIVSRDASDMKFVIGGGVARYEGVISPDGNTIRGTYTQTRSQPLVLEKATSQTAWVIDPTTHSVTFITTTDGVKLEVVDWGGQGRPLLFISGLGSTAHVFDKFVPLLTQKYRVYGVTRRGWGASDKADPARVSYMSDRLGDDVLQAMEDLKIEKPVLVGFSMGGSEMGSIVTRHPEKVAGLVYLDAAYAYAFYAPGTPMSLAVQTNDLKAKISSMSATATNPAEALVLVDVLLKTSLPLLQAELEANRTTYEARAAMPDLPPPPGGPPLSWAIADAISNGSQRYSDLKGIPILAIFASPQSMPPGVTGPMLTAMQKQAEHQVELIKRFEDGNPTARVVRIANAAHAVFRSHPQEVFREMTAFLDGLK
ncbi:MAG: alpha/beta hydrolase [Burkholderiales bacterium]|nr:MAG: alpha/beta hydrolase [Burkholderiales bacterium]